MNTRTTDNGKAAQQIIKALALPTASRAPAAPRPIPLSRLPRLPRETSMMYGIARVDPSGRVTSRGITDALRWRPGDRLAMTLTPSAVVLCPSPDGLLRVPRRPCIAIPVTARRLLSITPGDELLLAAAPEYRIVIAHTMQAMEDMLASFYAQIAADELPPP
jgi:bifunctional DNA-binding transcriptional regulator/antitoxin component of YhaV-PrlF toxin-antitoxin module